MELSTIDPTELKIRQVEIRQLSVKSFTSVSAYFERASVPSVSRKNRQHWCSSLQKGCDHIQIPLVHSLVLFDTLNPCPGNPSNLFINDDLPILYLPTNVTNPTGRSHSAMRSRALGSTSTFLVLSLNWINWMGYPSSVLSLSQPPCRAFDCQSQERLAQESQNCYLKLLWALWGMVGFIVRGVLLWGNGWREFKVEF